MNNKLSKKQIENLHRSGLSDVSIRKAGYSNETVFYNNEYRSAIGIPYRNPINGTFWFLRYRFDIAVKKDKGQPTRYYQQKGSNVQPYCSQLIDDEEWQAKTPNPSVASVIVEGEKKNDCLIQYQQQDRLVVGISGIYGWSKGKKELNDFISEHIAVPGREILLIFDSDVTTNTKIEVALLDLAKILEERGCQVYMVIVPSNATNPSEKVGIDDYLVELAEEDRTKALEELIKQKERLTINRISNRLEEIKALKTKDKLPTCYQEKNNGDVKPKDPVFENSVGKDIVAVALAQILNEEEVYMSETAEGVEVLSKYEKGIYKKIKPLHFRNYVVKRFEAAKTSQIRDKVYTELKDLVAREEIPWGKKLTQWQIPLQDFIWDCLHDCRIEHSPENYLRSVVTVDFFNPNEEIETPNWDKVVHNICITKNGEFDPKKGNLLHEIIGFCLSQRALLKLLLIFQGPRDSSKTLISKVLCDLIGAGFTAAFKIHRADDNFGLEILPGKLLAIDSEPKKDRSLKIDGAILKQLTGGEEDLYVNAKNKSHESKSLTTKFLLLANTLPDIDDDSGVIFDRLLILRFERTVKVPDIELHEKLKPEYKGIVHKAIKAYSNVAKRAQRGGNEIFTNPESTKRALEKYKAQNMPILKYCTQRLQKTGDPNDYVSFQDLYSDYGSFREVNSDLGLKKLSREAFSRALSKAQYKTAEHRPKKKGKRKRSAFTSEQSRAITALWGYKFIDQQE